MSFSRRTFLAAATAASYRRVLGANDRVGVGFIGFGLIGSQHVHDFRNQQDADMVALSDAYQPRLEQGVAACGGKARGYADFRKLLDDKDVEAVVVSTPDHWHALMTMMACAAGKDVYVEKPLTLFVREGRWMVDVARKHKRIVQVGTQQRSGPHYQRARDLLRSRYIGQLTSARMSTYRDIYPGFEVAADAATKPLGFDYDMWLGPAPARPYTQHRSLYHFRWFWDYSGGQMTNLGAHDLDIVQWVLDSKGPLAVTSTGGRWVLQDDGETPDTQDAIFEYPKFQVTFSIREAGGGKRGSGLQFTGTKGTLTLNRNGFQIEPEMKIDPNNAIPAYQGMPSGVARHSDVKPTPWIEPLQDKGSEADQLNRHARNFLDAVKSRQLPIADVEGGHRTATACHLANISLRTGRKIRWDAEREQIVGDAEANAMLERPYRKPWDTVLRNLLA